MNISSKNFKDLIRGVKSLEDLYNNRLRFGHEVDISIYIDEKKVVVQGDFELSEDLIFHEGEIYDKEIFFDGGNYKNIILKGGKFKKLFFRRGNFNGFVSIRGGKIENLVLLGGIFNHWLGTLDGILNEEDNIKLAEEPLVINRFEIEGGTYLNNIWISGGEISSLEIKCVSGVKIHCKPNDDIYFDTIENKYTNRFKSKPRIKNLLISRYSNKDSFYHFSELKIETIKFEHFTNIGNITISKISLEKHLSFENSDLGKTSFIDCNFANQILYFDSSKINDLALAGTFLPMPEKIYSKSDHKEVQKRLALSQIKKVYQNMGDSVTSSDYQTEELNTYMKTLKFGFEKFNLCLNRISNNHGQSWQRAFFLIIIFNTIFFTIYCFSLGFQFEINLTGKNYFWNNASYFLEFINPIRKNDFLPKALINKSEFEINSKSIFIDSIAKLINAYLIYQFVAAFRRYGKKNE